MLLAFFFFQKYRFIQSFDMNFFFHVLIAIKLYWKYLKNSHYSSHFNLNKEKLILNQINERESF